MYVLRTFAFSSLKFSLFTINYLSNAFLDDFLGSVDAIVRAAHCVAVHFTNFEAVLGPRLKIMSKPLD